MTIPYYILIIFYEHYLNITQRHVITYSNEICLIQLDNIRGKYNKNLKTIIQYQNIVVFD